MGLVYEIVLTVLLVGSFGLNAWAIRQTNKKVNAIDADATDAFGFVGDKVGELAVQLRTVLDILTDPEDEEDEDKDDEDEDDESFPWQTPGIQSQPLSEGDIKALLAGMGVTVIELPATDSVELPMIDGDDWPGRGFGRDARVVPAFPEVDLGHDPYNHAGHLLTNNAKRDDGFEESTLG